MANLSTSPIAARDAQDIDRARAADTPRAGATTARRDGLLHSATRRFAVAGFAFGALVPIFATLLSLFVDRLPLNPASLLDAQRTQPLLWIIDTAPLVL